jgi:hypothetical protein
MAQVEVVENPRRKRHRYTALQRSYGFGGSRTRNRRRRRRNPALMELANPRRRRRRRNEGLGMFANRRRRSRNPALLGGLGNMFDLNSMLWVGTGMFGSKALPQIVKARIWAGMPTDGIAGYAVRVGVTFALSQVVKMLTKSTQKSQLVMTGGMAALLYDVFTQQVAPMIGLSGLSGLGEDDYITEEELRPVLEGYVDTGSGDGSAYFDEKNVVGEYLPAAYGGTW